MPTYNWLYDTRRGAYVKHMFEQFVGWSDHYVKNQPGR